MDINVFSGTFVHCPSTSIGGDKADEDRKGITSLEIKNGLIGVKGSQILFISEKDKEEELRAEYGFNQEEIIKLNSSEFLCPGFVDTHIHASQYCNCGLALDLPLLDWLKKYTFPTEAKYEDPTFAKEIYSSCLNRSLRNGTTTAQYFSTIHCEASELLVDLAIEKGQRIFTGKVSMDQNSAEYYIEDTTKSLQDTERCIESILRKQSPLVTPVVTPRFAPSCTMELLSGLGEIAKKYDIPIQTHISESVAECEWVKELFPCCEDYVDVYDKAGLLTSKTTLAHGIYLSDEELEKLKARETKVSHCPNSNCSLRSGLCDVRRLEKFGVTVGLGTDVSGGYSASILDAMRCAITVSNIIATTQGSSYVPLNFRDALRLATIDGAKTLGISDKVGNFEVGKEFDALRIDLAPPSENIDLFGTESPEDLVQKFVFLGDDRNIRQAYVAGRKVVDNY